MQFRVIWYIAHQVWWTDHIRSYNRRIDGRAAGPRSQPHVRCDMGTRWARGGKLVVTFAAAIWVRCKTSKHQPYSLARTSKQLAWQNSVNTSTSRQQNRAPKFQRALCRRVQTVHHQPPCKCIGRSNPRAARPGSRNSCRPQPRPSFIAMHCGTRASRHCCVVAQPFILWSSRPVVILIAVAPCHRYPRRRPPPLTQRRLARRTRQRYSHRQPPTSALCRPPPLAWRRRL